VHFRQRFHDLHYELESALGERGGRCLEDSQKGTPTGEVMDWFVEEIKALPETFAEANKNIVCFAVAGVFRMLEDFGCASTGSFGQF
jgi:hypothetical protein